MNPRGADVWREGPGADHLTDFAGRDRILGGRGGDSCLVTPDGHADDMISGGPGTDVWHADRADDVAGVEVQAICFAE